ncbi:MAG TPA: PQQ-binding-like beta-propeller repeat protein [Pirellulales bacterium]|nr:PQQ-binding-like beta-propeller repeat protein [Pirellulales bacterium]
MRFCTACLSLAFVFCALQIAAAADEWPQFRGPDGQGHAPNANPPTQWSEEQNVAWKTALPGSGHSSPVIGGGLIWLTYALDQGKSLGVAAVDVKSGKIVRQREILTTDVVLSVNAKNSHASPTAVLDGDRLYVHYGSSGTACVSTADAQPLWTNTDLKVDHQEGPGSSPILWGDLLIVHCDGRDLQYIAALDKRTGRLAWKTDRSGELPEKTDFRKAFCTPLVIELEDGESEDGESEDGESDDGPLLISPAAQRVFAYRPATGEEVWSVEYSPGFSNVPRPLFGHGLLYICTGYMRPELWAIRPGGRGDVTSTNVAWKFKQNAPANPSPLLVGDELYLVSDAGIATCLDAKSGKQIWRQRLGGSYSASPLYAAGRIYFCNEAGETTVIEAGRSYRQLAKNELDAGIMASPAAIDSALFVRTRTHLYRLENSRSAVAGVLPAK